MKPIQEAILDEFLDRLGEAEAFNGAQIDGLRELLSGGTKPKADEVVSLFSQPKEPDPGS